MREKPVFNAWKLYWEIFKDGDVVVIITDDDKIDWGKLITKEKGIWLCRAMTDEWYDWDDIRFMCCDGFPVRKLMGADGSKSIESMDTTNLQKMAREKLSFDEDRMGDNRKIIKRAVFGDPFMIENVSGVLLNAGNVWTPGYNLNEEVMVLKSNDGAKGMLWGIPTIYYLEI